jgi:hypothetical protein
MLAAQCGSKEALSQAGKMIVAIVDNAKALPKWARYNGECAEYMRDEAILACWKNLKKYDPAKSSPYSFFLMITNHYFNYGVLKFYRHTTGEKSENYEEYKKKQAARMKLDRLSQKIVKFDGVNINKKHDTNLQWQARPVQCPRHGNSRASG